MSGTTNTNLNTAFGRPHADYWDPAVFPTAVRYKATNLYVLGVDGSYNIGSALLSRYAFYQFGKIDLLGGTFVGDNVIAGDNFDVKAMAQDLRVDGTLGPGKFFLEGAYVTGSDENDDDFKAPVTASNYALAGSFPLTSMDMQILFPNIDDINASVALAYDVQNKGRGILAFAAGYRMNFNDKTAGKRGVGYLSDLEVFVGQNEDGVGVKKHSAIEVNANVNYTVTKGLDVGLYGAYAFLSDWEDYGTTTPAATATRQANMTRQADDIYKLMWRFNYAF